VPGTVDAGTVNAGTTNAGTTNAGTMEYRVDRRVAYVRFGRPERMNSIDEDTLADLAWLIGKLSDDPELRAVVLTGSGRAFSVGLDLGLLQRAFADLDYFESVLRRLNAFYTALEDLPMPVVASVNGIARAGGYEILLASDLVVISEDARVGDVHAPFGVPPGGGASYRLSRRVGEQRAKELIFTGRWLEGPETVTYGIALRAVPADSLEKATEELVEQLRDKPRSCVGTAKAMIHDSRYLPTVAAAETELRAFMDWARTTADPGEGMRAFVEHRAPKWD
jgi:enoyl-CoA hydratase/carnithine racemase